MENNNKLSASLERGVRNRKVFQKESNQPTLRVRMEEVLAKYWYDNEYSKLDHKDHEKCKESRENFHKWIDDNIEMFLKPIKQQ